MERRKTVKRQMIITWTVAVVFASLAVMSQVQADTEKKPSQEQVVVTIGDKTITLEDLNARIDTMPAPYQQRFASPERKKELIDLMVKSILLAEEARRLEVDKRKDVRAKIEEMTNNILAQELIKDEVRTKAQVTEEEVRDYYEKNLKEFTTPEKIKARHILLKIGKNATPEEKATRQEKAEEALKKARSGEDFATLAGQYSEDAQTSNKGGYLGLIPRGRRGDAFDEVAFRLDEGEISGIVETPRGLEIIKAEEKKPASTRELDKVRRRIENKLSQAKQKERYEALIEELKKRFPVTIHEELLGAKPSQKTE
jgi:parvulin-like peptidyl-prolyl isomerase